MSEAPGPSSRGPLWAGALALVLLLLGLPLAASAGHLSIDEGVYHLMTRESAQGRPFDLRTGYAEIESPELLHVVPGRTAHTQRYDGRVVSQYPYLFPAMASPLYGVAGAASMTLLNVLAAAVGIGVAFAIAWRITGRTRAGIVAAGSLMLGGFWLDYGYAMWPHVAATTAWLGGVALLWPGERRVSRCFVAGLLLGVAWSIRLDAAVLAMGTLAIAALPPARLRSSLAAGAGLGVMVLVLALTHLVKFGTLNPLSYGVPVDARTAGVSRYVPLLVLGGASTAAAVLARFGRARTSRPRLGVAAALLVVAGLWQWPALADLASGARALVFDLGLIDPVYAETQQLRSGALVYGDAVKKSLLQSCPQLLAVAVLFVGALRATDANVRRGCAMLVLPVLALTAVFAMRSWHGGASINMRYFVPWLPVLAVAAAVGLEHLLERCRDLPRRVWLVGPVALVASAAVGVHLLELSPVEQDPIVRFVPLGLAVAALVPAGWWTMRPSSGKAIATAIAGQLALAWSVGMGAHDLARSVANRERHAQIGAAVAERIEPNALVITQVAAPLYGLFEQPDILLASAQSDRGGDLGRLTHLGLNSGRPVYLVFVAAPTTGREFAQKLPGVRFTVSELPLGLALFRVEPVPRGDSPTALGAP